LLLLALQNTKDTNFEVCIYIYIQYLVAEVKSGVYRV
jgi:hypothetical protein